MLPWATSDEGSCAHRVGKSPSPVAALPDRFLGNRSLHTAAAQRPPLVSLRRQQSARGVRARSAARRQKEQEELLVEPEAMKRAASLVPFRQRRFATPISSARGPQREPLGGEHEAAGVEAVDDAVHTEAKLAANVLLLGPLGSAQVSGCLNGADHNREIDEDYSNGSHEKDYPASMVAVPVKRRFTDPGEAVVKLQRWWRRCLEERELMMETLVQQLMAMRCAAAEDVQRLWRGHNDRQKYRSMLRSAR